MSLSAPFRNVDFDHDAPVDEWPMEAIETVMDRGNLSDWRVLASAIAARPWGPASRHIETIASWGEHYGVDPLMLNVVQRAREAARLRARMEYAQRIREWRRVGGYTLRALAAEIGTSAGRLADYESGKTAPTTEVLGRIEHACRR